MHLELGFVSMRDKHLFFVWISSFSAPFVEDIISSLACILGLFIKNQMAVILWTSLCSFYSTRWWACLHSCQHWAGFVSVALQWNLKSDSWCLRLYSSWLGLLCLSGGCCAVLWILRFFFSISVRNSKEIWLGFPWPAICRDSFRQGGCFHNECSNPWAQVVFFHLVVSSSISFLGDLKFSL